MMTWRMGKEHTMVPGAHSPSWRRVTLALWLGGLALLLAAACPAAAPPAARQATQETFASPQAAVAALQEAVQKQDREALRRLFGPEVKDLLSGDQVQDRQYFETFAARLNDGVELGKVQRGRVTLYIGDNHWPFAIPLARRGKRWYFDTRTGKTELLARRIGANELDAIQVCLAVHLAQEEYQAQKQEYARRLLSSPGKQDGLYWQTADGERPSPLGPLIAQAAEQGYGGTAREGQPRPYHGYLYRLLTRQGPHAPGGARDYLQGDRLTGGFALVVSPAKWGSSGVMTFLVGPQGKVYQRNLGPKTAQLAAKMTAFDPDPFWKPALPAQPSYVTGSVLARQPIQLPSEAVVTVYLVDVTQHDAPRVIGKQVITDAERVPLRFAVEYDPARIEAGHAYALAANVLAEGKLRWKQAEPVPALTKGHSHAVDVLLQPVQPRSEAEGGAP